VRERLEGRAAAEFPIGVFDSGLGGLTVVRAIRARLPKERIVYLGDSARVPYGTRSPETIERYAWNCSSLLVRRGLKMLVVACNTASAVALGSLRQRIEEPVLGVIKAGARAAAAATRNRRIGVIGTAGTVGSGAYPREIDSRAPGCAVFQNPAPLLVPLAEEGWLEGEVPALAVRRYVAPLVAEGIDVLLLGCTHYPLLAATIRRELDAMGCAAAIVDSATAMAVDVGIELKRRGTERLEGDGALECLVTDLPASFADVAGRFLGAAVGSVEKVDIS
jgi:glutamate racemase